MEMKDRIKKIMEKEGFNPASFADYLGINRQTMNATLGRNKTASINIVYAILEKYEDLNSDWLLLGKGPMYKGEKAFLQPDLFENIPVNAAKPADISEYSPKNIVQERKKDTQKIVNKIDNIAQKTSTKIEKIIIFYTDKTFETLIPEKF